MAISMLKIRRPLGRLIFNMGIAIPGKTVFLIETGPRPTEGQMMVAQMDIVIHLGVIPQEMLNISITEIHKLGI